MQIHLYDHFTYKKLLKFTFPSIVMMIFTSIYGVVDGFFVSNFAGKTDFAAVNFIMPFLMILGAIGFMFGSGGGALISKTLGEGNQRKAQELFSLFIWLTVGCAVVIGAFGIIFIDEIAVLLGAEGEMLDSCVRYGRIILLALPAFMLQFEFQNFCVTAEKPQLGLIVTIAAGVTNMVLDAVLVMSFPAEIKLEGAAIATAASQLVGGIVPVIYFSRKNDSLLKLVKPKFDVKSLLKACANGSSELMSNLSMSLVGMLYNVQLMKYAGEDGVSAYGVMMYVNMIFLSAYIGYSVGTAPIIGYHYGAGNSNELKSILKKSAVLISVCSLLMLGFGEAMAYPLSKLFVGYDAALMSLTLGGFRIFCFSFLFAGIAIFGSSFFTALNNGLVSAIISFLRTLVFQIAAVMLMPLVWDVDGIWWSVVVAEIMAVVATLFFLGLNRKKYNY